MTTQTYLPATVPNLEVSDELTKNSAIEFTREKQEFVRWLQGNVRTKSMRTLAVEAASYHFADQHLHRQIERRLAELEELYRRQLNLLEMARQHRIKVVVDWKQMEVTLAQADFRRAKLVQATGKLLEPANWQEMQRSFDAERLQLVKTRLDIKRKRYLLTAATADAAERSRLRAEFIAKARTEFTDPKAVEEAIEEYDRTLFRFTGDGSDQ